MDEKIAVAAVAVARRRFASICSAILLIGLNLPAALAEPAPADAEGPDAGKTGKVVAQNTPAPTTTAPVEEVTVTANRIQPSPMTIDSHVGSSTYSFSQDDIQKLPGGDNASMNTVLLHAPGVDQDSAADGGIHIRNEHLDLQYRIDGVMLPEGASFFGQGLSPRFASSMQLITGALPAEYGLRTAGIVDIQSKGGLLQPGGSFSVYGGSYGMLQTSADYGGSIDGYNYFFAADNMVGNHGTNAPTSGYNAVHDGTVQSHAFGYLDKAIDASSKVSFLLGTFQGQFQIPNNPGQTAAFPVFGSLNFNSADLTEHQSESSTYGVLSYLRSQEDLDFQVSAFSKYSRLNFHPDIWGDLAFNGIAQSALRQDVSSGLQADTTYRLNPTHTLRAGIMVSGERSMADTSSWVLPVTGMTLGGDPLYGSTPQNIVDNSGKTGFTYSAYLQDEWKLTSTLTLNYGGRFDAVNAYTDESQFSPRVNAVWKPSGGTTFHVGYANYFSPPPLELVSGAAVSQFANTSGATPSLQNSPVKAERSHYFDAGVTQDVLPGFKVGLDVYYKYARNLIDEGQFGAPVVLTPFNYHVGYNRGVELTTSYERGNFSFYGNLAIAQQKAEGISSGQYNFSPEDLAYINSHLINTDHSQRMTASAGVSYLWQDTRFSMDLIAGTGLRCGCSAGDNANEGTVPSYEQVNFGVSHRFADAPGGPITVRLDLINALDEVYLLRSQTGIGVFANQYGPRRSLYAGVTKEF